MQLQHTVIIYVAMQVSADGINLNEFVLLASLVSSNEDFRGEEDHQDYGNINEVIFKAGVVLKTK